MVSKDVVLMYLALAFAMTQSPGMSTNAPLTPLRQSYARHIRLQRESMRMSQQELARRIGVDRSYVGKLERAEINVSLATMDKVRAELLTTVPIPVTYRISVAQRVQEARKGRLSQERLSEIAGFSVLFVGRLERGLVNTSIDYIDAIARALGAEPADFLAS